MPVDQSTSPRPRRTRRYWRRMVLLATTAILLTTCSVPALLGFITTASLLYMPCGAHATTPGDFGYQWEDVTIKASAGGSFNAYFIPGSNGAAVIIPPATSSGAGNRLHEADVVLRHGYSVLAFESRPCAGMGTISLGYKETSEVGDALAYLQTRDDVHSDQIAVFGFSSAGATSVMAAAHYPGLRAVIAEGGYGDFADGVIGWGQIEVPVLETIYKASIRLSYRIITGTSVDNLSPLNVIDQIAPRPILLIYGSQERSLEGARQQLAAAGENANLWVVEGSGHGDYLETSPQEYETRVIAFLDRALLDGGVSINE